MELKLGGYLESDNRIILHFQFNRFVREYKEGEIDG